MTEEGTIARVLESSLVVIGAVVEQAPDPSSAPGGHIDLRPEAFLKGNVTAGLIRFRTAETDACADPAKFLTDGDRVLVIARRGSTTDWPGPSNVFLLKEGTATSFLRGDAGFMSESGLIELIRHETNQFAVPAQSAAEGEGIDWVWTVLPVGGATLAILAVSLYLMRIWHRIDPS
ncbi:MAG: hypothetical protein R3B97_14685 [Dehalococcoidia bacterium]|nr:hypothetical protein [Dehalococcoidia bacterium]MCB9486877.1 hypothetical protein [Thermoflexaceae bacterium]